MGGYKFDRDEYWRRHREGATEHLERNSKLSDMLHSIALPKYIFTNCREKEAHDALMALGLDTNFNAIYGADFLGDTCKVQVL